MIRADASQIALNDAASQDAPTLGAALAISLNAEGAPCEWIMLVPRGPQIKGNDGRVFKLRDPQKIVDAFKARGLSRPIDINHAQAHKAPKGEESPAAGWIEEMAVRDGAVWGRVDWTARGSAALAGKDYRYISPALRVTADGDVVELAHAGLVNDPNFTMPALNAAEEKNLMNKELLKRLGLAENATEAEVLAAIERLQTQLNAAKDATPSLSVYVPRADYDLACQQRDEARAALNARDESERKAKGEALVEQAVKDGKIAPATKDFYLKLCASEDGLKQVQDFVAKQPSHFAKAGLDDEAKAGKDGVQLNADERRYLQMAGVSEKEFLAAREAEREAKSEFRSKAD
ncbi:MAG TPA: phage protease [Methylocystis sp.]|jgi:phage I-like protein